MENRNKTEERRPITQTFLVWLLAFAAGATVANIYYGQPLLEMLGRHFQANPGAVSGVSIATQLGYASGLLFIVPLGDSFERRWLIVASVIASSVILLIVGLSPGLPFMVGSSYLLGLASITPQLIVPYAAGMVSVEVRGRIVGKVMSGLLIGILFSRTVSGFIGARTGWRTVFFLASGAMLLLAVSLFLILPKQRPERRIAYKELLGSMWPILRDQPVLRRHALIGALGFGAFSALWTTLSFYLSDRPEHFNSQVTGLFGLVGVAGAFVAPISGRVSDRVGARIVGGIALGLTVLSFGIMGLANLNLVWLVVGVFLMDAGVQGSQLSNQVRIFSLAPELRNRINGIYIFLYFIGGACGSALGSFAWEEWHWPGVCLLGGVLGLAGMGVLFFRSGTSRSLEISKA